MAMPITTCEQSRGDTHMKPFIRWLTAALLGTACSVALADNGDRGGADRTANDLTISTASTRPYTVSGGDVLVRIDDDSNRPMAAIHVELNHLDISNLFQLQSDGSLL